MKKHRSFKPEQKARAVLQVLTGQNSAREVLTIACN
jgi:transposase-like protein